MNHILKVKRTLEQFLVDDQCNLSYIWLPFRGRIIGFSGDESSDFLSVSVKSKQELVFSRGLETLRVLKFT